MWDPRRLTTLWAFTACYRDSLKMAYKTNMAHKTSAGRNFEKEGKKIINTSKTL
jgi:hypothetical protein